MFLFTKLYQKKKFFFFSIEKKEDIQMAAELGAIVTIPRNAYGTLDEYNSIFGPPVSPIIPPMQYISLPQDHANYGYNTLSHDYDGVGYYNVEDGYGKKCTTFGVAKCPSNLPISPPAPTFQTTSPPQLKENFFFERFSNEQSKAIKDLQLDVFVDIQNCPHCARMVSMLKNFKGVVTIKDISDNKHKKELLSKGGTGVPYTYSKRLHVSVAGVPPNLPTLIQTLHATAQKKPSVHVVHKPEHAPAGKKLSPNVDRKLKDLQISVYTSESCHFCTLYKQFIDRNGLRPYVHLVPVENKAIASADPFLRTNQLPAYPFTYSRKYTTSFAGLPNSVDEIINSLTKQNI